MIDMTSSLTKVARLAANKTVVLTPYLTSLVSRQLNLSFDRDVHVVY